MNIWCIHGNLQVPSVWDPIVEAYFQKHLAGTTSVNFKKVKVWDWPADSISDWVTLFLTSLKKTGFEAGSQWLMGYSLGGRLALHALLQKPDMWGGAVIIAAHPGIKTKTERLKQCERDDIWAERFREEPWEELIKEWNQLPIFCNRLNPFELKEKVISRETISQAFNVFSKGRQSYLMPQLKKNKDVPVLYIAGNEDAKYTQIGLELAKQCSGITLSIIEGACHRVPWENTERFVEVVQQFVIENG